MEDAIELARAVIARGHTESEAHRLAVALLACEAWRAYWAACTRYEWACSKDSPTADQATALEREIRERRAALRALGEEP